MRQYRAVRDAGARRRYAAPMRALAVGPLAGAAVGHRDRLTVFRVLWWAIR